MHRSVEVAVYSVIIVYYVVLDYDIVSVLLLLSASMYFPFCIQLSLPYHIPIPSVHIAFHDLDKLRVWSPRAAGQRLGV